MFFLSLLISARSPASIIGSESRKCVIVLVGERGERGGGELQKEKEKEKDEEGEE